MMETAWDFRFCLGWDECIDTTHSMLTSFSSLFWCARLQTFFGFCFGSPARIWQCCWGKVVGCLCLCLWVGLPGTLTHLPHSFESYHDEIGRLTAQQEKGVMNGKLGKLLTKLGAITSLLPFCRWETQHTRFWCMKWSLLVNRFTVSACFLLNQSDQNISCCRCWYKLRNEMTPNMFA